MAAILCFSFMQLLAGCGMLTVTNKDGKKMESIEELAKDVAGNAVQDVVGYFDDYDQLPDAIRDVVDAVMPGIVGSAAANIAGNGMEQSSGGNHWPTDEFIPDGAEYTGSGDICHVENLANEELEIRSVYIDGAELDDVFDYIEELRDVDVDYAEAFDGDEEPDDTIAGMLVWKGSNEDDSFAVFIIYYENSADCAYAPDTEYNLEIHLANGSLI